MLTVKELRKPQMWRQLLGRSIEDPRERQRIANALNVNPITLTRWVKQESNPRPENLQRLLDTLPGQRDVLLTLIMEEFEDFSPIGGEVSLKNVSTAIPVEFYARVLHTLTTIPKTLLFWSLRELIVQQALKQLDPHRLGMAIIVAECMPPLGEHKVRSLREVMGRGTPPWEGNLDQELILLGAESLTGNAVISGHLVTNQDLQEGSSLASGYRSTWEKSAAAAPIIHANDIAGTFLVSSTQPNYFSQQLCTLIERYAELIALAFDPNNFYEVQRIELGAMPPYEVQRPIFFGFRQRIINTMLQATKNQQPITSIQAEWFVWQQLEEELLNTYVPFDREMKR